MTVNLWSSNSLWGLWSGRASTQSLWMLHKLSTSWETSPASDLRFQRHLCFRLSWWRHYFPVTRLGSKCSPFSLPSNIWKLSIENWIAKDWKGANLAHKSASKPHWGRGFGERMGIMKGETSKECQLCIESPSSEDNVVGYWNIAMSSHESNYPSWGFCGCEETP